MTPATDCITADQASAFGQGYLPGPIGVEFLDVGDGFVEAELAIRKERMAPNGFLHAASIVALADTACGYGCMQAVPEGAAGFITLELKSNFLSAARDGVIACRAEAQRLGRITQLWDATVKAQESGMTIALFRYTQMVL